MTDFADNLPNTAILFAMMIARLNSICNSILYGVFNPAYAHGYMNFLYFLVHGKRALDRKIILQSSKVFIVEANSQNGHHINPHHDHENNNHHHGDF